VLTRPGFRQAPIFDGLNYVAEHNQHLFVDELSRTLAFEYDIAAEIASLCSLL
jgi:hypothetical protein